MFEERTQVHVVDSGVKVLTPSGEEHFMPWSEVRGISIETNDSGPYGSDVHWLVSSDERSLSFPMGATGEQEALSHFQTLPGFDNGKLLEAMRSTEDALFLLWQK